MTNTQFLLPVWDTISIAWSKVKGSKKSIWAAFLIIFLVALGLGLIQGLFKHFFPTASVPIGLLIQLINYLLQMGLIYLGIQRAFDLPLSYRMMFRSFEFDIAIRIIGLYILQILVFLPAMLIIFAASFLYAYAKETAGFFSMTIAALLMIVAIVIIIVLAVRLMLSMAFVLDKKANPWEAIKFSFHATRSNFWRLVGIGFLQGIILVISAIPLGIGLIWTIPLVTICYGQIYKTLLVNVRK